MAVLLTTAGARTCGAPTQPCFTATLQGQPQKSLALQLYSEQGDLLSNFLAPAPTELAADSARNRIYVRSVPTTAEAELKIYTFSAPQQLVNSSLTPAIYTLAVAADGSLWTGNIDP